MKMPNLQEFAMSLLEHNPNIANNQQAQSFISVIKSGDAAKGEQIARNICQTMGVSPEQAEMQAKNFFHIPR